MAFVPSLTILAAVKTALEALAVSEADTSPLFAEVRIFGRKNLRAAIEELFQFEDRLAILVPSGWDHRTVLHGTEQRSRRHAEFIVMLSDRNFGGEGTATTGEAGENPGVVTLAERVVAALAGQTLGLAADWVSLQPGHGEPLTLSAADEKELTGRAAWVQEFSTDAGEVITETGRLHVQGDRR